VGRKKIPARVKSKKWYKQSGERKSLLLDRVLSAKKPGYRKSKTGKKYMETRKNRSDMKNKRI